MDNCPNEPVRIVYPYLMSSRRHKDDLRIVLAQSSQVFTPPPSSKGFAFAAEQRVRILSSTTPAVNQYPRVFQAWNRAENLKGEDDVATMARHDLMFTTPEALRLLSDGKYPGLATGFTPASVANATGLREQLLAKNPHMLILASIQYRDAFPDYFPADSIFWQRNANKEPVNGWVDTASDRVSWKIDFTQPAVQDLVVSKCLASMRTGVVDGIMLDWWNDGESDTAHNQARLDLLQKLRSAVGPDALILLNANDLNGAGNSTNEKLLKQSAPLANGVFMESVQTILSVPGAAPKYQYTKSDWAAIEQALAWNEANMRQPRINCLELWFETSRQDERLMRAATTLALTRSNGFVLFSDPNHLASPDHLHDWYDFWNRRLGKPLESSGKTGKDGSSVREFEQGTVVYNSILNRGPVTVSFSDRRIRVSTADAKVWPTGTKFVIQPCDGDLFLKAD